MLLVGSAVSWSTGTAYGNPYTCCCTVAPILNYIIIIIII